MANNPDTLEVIRTALCGWLLGSKFAAATGIPLKGALPYWPPPGSKRQYPEATVVDVGDPEVTELDPVPIDDAAGVTSGFIAQKTGEVTGKLQVDFWCNNPMHVGAIRKGLQKALRADPRRPGLYLTPADHWGQTVSYELDNPIRRNDTEDAVLRSEYRLSVKLAVETAVVEEYAAAATSTVVKTIVAVDTTNPNDTIDSALPPV